MSSEENHFGKLLGNFFDKKTAEQFQNLINDKETMEKLSGLASKIGPQLISCQLLNEILDSDPKLTDEYLTEEINSLKKIRPDVSEMIGKYLQSYQQTNDSKKPIYQIRRFLQSGDCKRALEDEQVKKYLQELFNSPEFQQKLNKHSVPIKRSI